MSKTKEYFDNWAKSYDSLGSSYPFFLSFIFDSIINKLNLSKKPTILDLGTGTGRLLLEIAGKNKECNFIGIDVSDKMIEKAKENFKKIKLKAEFLIGNMEKIDLKENSIDYAVSFGAIHHVKNKDTLFKEVYRILKPKAKLVYGDSFEKFGDSSKELDKEYEQELKKLKKENPEFSRKFSKSVWDTYNSLSKEIKEKHPKEHHIEPCKLKRLLQKTGFKKVKIRPFPDYFAMVEGEK